MFSFCSHCKTHSRVCDDDLMHFNHSFASTCLEIAFWNAFVNNNKTRNAKKNKSPVSEMQQSTNCYAITQPTGQLKEIKPWRT